MGDWLANLTGRTLIVASLLAISSAAPAWAQDSASTGADAGNAASETAPDPRAGDPVFEQANKLMRAIDGVLKDVAEERVGANKLPSNDDFLVTPIWTETREDRETRIRELLDAALGVVTDVPIVDLQKSLEGRRQNIRELQGNITTLRERQMTAPTDSLLPGILADTVDSLDGEIKDLEKRVEDNHEEIAKTKIGIQDALRQSGIEMSDEQLDLLLDSVLSGDLVRLVATFNAAKLIDEQLGRIVSSTGDNVAATRKYFAMHAALFAMLVHAQDSLIHNIDAKYLPRLEAIDRDVRRASRRTQKLMRGRNRPDQLRALQANARSQKFARRVARYYRSYLLQQREQLAAARLKATRDLKIADNTYETVEASFQLRALIRDAASSFEAIQKLQAPGFDQIFRDQELRREFENLTRQLDVPAS